MFRDAQSELWSLRRFLNLAAVGHEDIFAWIVQGLAETQLPAELRTGKAPPSRKPDSADAAADDELGGDSPTAGAAAAAPGKLAAASPF